MYDEITVYDLYRTVCETTGDGQEGTDPKDDGAVTKIYSSAAAGPLSEAAAPTTTTMMTVDRCGARARHTRPTSFRRRPWRNGRGLSSSSVAATATVTEATLSPAAASNPDATFAAVHHP